jgi:hypothetical protein
LVECGQGGGERGTRLVVQAVEPRLQHGRPAGAHLGELGAADFGDLDEHGSRVLRVTRLAHEAVLLEPVDEHGHRRLGDELGGGEVGHALRAIGVQAPQGEQSADAAAAGRMGAQELRDERDAALELSGEIFDSSTI